MIHLKNSDSLREKRSYGHLALCFALPALFMLLLYFLMKIPPIGDGTFLVLDMNGQYIYFFEALREAIFGEGSFIYSFSRALGGEFLGIYAYYLASPLSYITLLFPADRILEAVFTVIILKTGLCGLTFGFYLTAHTERPRKYATVMFSLMYALSAYAIVYQSNTMWMDALIWLPLLTLGLERLYREGRFKLYIISLIMAILSNYYIGYMLCLYSLLYFLYLCVCDKSGDGGYRHYLKKFVSFGLYSILAAAVCGALLFAAYHSLTLGKYGFSSPDSGAYLKLNPLELLSKLLPSAYDTVRPQGLPFIYCGTLTLILLPLYFLRKDISPRERLGSLLLLSALFISFCLYPIDIIWHGGQEPHWLNCRYSFIFSFLLLVFSYRALIGIERVKEKHIIISASAILSITVILSLITLETYITSEERLLSLETVALTVISVILGAAILITASKSLKKGCHTLRKASAAALALLVCSEVFINGAVLMRQFDKDVCYSTHSGYTGYIGALRPVSEALGQYDSSFYRAEKLNHRKFNDNMALGLYGVSGSTSTLHAASVNLLGQLGYVGDSHYTQYKGGDPVGDSLLGIKYLIDSKDSDDAPSEKYALAFTEGEYSVWRNPYALSVAFGVDKALLETDLTAYSTSFERLNAIASAAAGYSETVEIFTPVESYEVYGSSTVVSYENGAKVYSPNYSREGAFVNFEFKAERGGEYFFYPKLMYPTETELKINGEYYGDYLDNKNQNKVSLGCFSTGETVKISLKITEPFYLLEDTAPIMYLDGERFDEVFDKLTAAPSFTVREGSGNTVLEGNVTTDKPNTSMLLTLPYDKGLRIYIDGEEIEFSPCLGALVSFEIPNAGEHTLQIKYFPRIYILGAAVSAVGITVLTYLLLKKKKSAHHEKSAPAYWD